VRDDGVGCDAHAVRAGGVGLANTRDRLRYMYGARQQLDVVASPGGGVRVEMRLPLRTRPVLASA
jgi:signal transduction histidine kinase